MNRVTIICILATAACDPFEAIVDCEPIGNAVPLCGWQNPEDLAALYVAYSLTGELRRFNRHIGQVENSALFDPIDNLTWAPDGSLVAAVGLAGVREMMPCLNGLDEGTCPGAHAILAVDPDTLDSDVIYEGGPGTPGGAGTTGLVLDDGTLLVGTFAGDRVVRVTGVW